MPKIQYKNINFSAARMTVIEQANEIIDEYTAKGFDLTLRQLYYQFVSRDLIPNKQQEYKRLGDIINDARLAGLVDWEAITDRTRNLRRLSDWNDPAEIIGACAQQFRIDLWAGQKHRLEVWIEKDALIGVIENVCNELRVPHFSCRGYTSASEVWGASQRLLRWKKTFGQKSIIIHLGDHDPSGIDMTRDIQDRLNLFAPGVVEIRRLALNMNQVEEYSPPPNPAKSTDSRYTGYEAEYGNESWELDALDPEVIETLIRAEILKFCNRKLWDEKTTIEDRMKQQIGGAANRWDDVCSFISGNGKSH